VCGGLKGFTKGKKEMFELGVAMMAMRWFCCQNQALNPLGPRPAAALLL